MTEFVHAVVRFAEAHAALIYVLAFLATYLESIAVLGFLIPGSSIIVALGALIPSGAVGFWWLCLWSIIGAVAGDASSYWIGNRYSDRLRNWWPLRRHPSILDQGERFFAKHGGKSVFLARFVGPVRGAVPLVAGMARLGPRSFYAANVLSAIGWAPAHIVPGMLIGAGLTLTGAVATRLLVLAIVLAACLWLAVKLAVLLVRRGVRLLTQAQDRLEGWACARNGWLSRQVLALFDPASSEARALMLFGLILVAAAGTFFGVLEDVVTGDPLVRADLAIYNMLQGLRSGVADRFMIAITELGSTTVAGAVAAAVLCWLGWRRAWHAAGYWVAAVGGASLIGLVIKVTLHRPRPVPLPGGWDAFSFPSGHATTNAAMYGFIAVLLAREVRPVWQALIVATVSLLVTLIGFSRLYLGAHWFSDVMGGISFGSAWVALLAIAYVRHDPPRLPPLHLSAVAALIIVGLGSIQIAYKMPVDLERYALRQSQKTMAAEDWWHAGWRHIPLRRIDLVGEREEPLVLQWAGGLGDLKHRFTAAGWRSPAQWSIASAQMWLSAQGDLLTLPVLPRLHDGREAALTLIHQAGGPDRPTDRWVLRIWDTGTRITWDRGRNERLWVGAITLQRFHGALAPLELGFERGRIDVPWALLKRALSSVPFALQPGGQKGVRVMLARANT